MNNHHSLQHVLRPEVRIDAPSLGLAPLQKLPLQLLLLLRGHLAVYEHTREKCAIRNAREAHEDYSRVRHLYGIYRASWSTNTFHQGLCLV